MVDHWVLERWVNGGWKLTGVMYSEYSAKHACEGLNTFGEYRDYRYRKKKE